ncbi:hypothetical protein MMG85_03550 [Pseudoxanthomonas sp. LH2527]|uniref:hypothetical protein n=1 Tax=Pseudoxanthomonas sp. LH2527 TaxID=2923249 RepID=UPI001F143F9B|nr:hypothetical protein [Pseudoxanthomonas sp. LH2527]MCH6482647.1 hypothetical protein [Pseudoxanthomonas sp. LH2527]
MTTFTMAATHPARATWMGGACASTGSVRAAAHQRGMQVHDMLEGSGVADVHGQQIDGAGAHVSDV